MDIEQELVSVARKHARHVTAAKEIEPQRDDLIRKAIAEKMPRRRIMQITGLSLQRIDQIRRRARL